MISLSGYRSDASRRVRGGSETLRSASFDLFAHISVGKKYSSAIHMLVLPLPLVTKLCIIVDILFKNEDKTVSRARDFPLSSLRQHIHHRQPLHLPR